MSYPVTEKLYLKMMRKFVQGEIDAHNFVKQFFDVRNKDKDKEWAITATWDKPYDQLLIADLRKEKISQEEFSQKWDKLFGWSQKEKKFLQILDRVFTACDSFINEPSLITDPEHTYDEYQLRSVIARELQEYERCKEQS